MPKSLQINYLNTLLKDLPRKKLAVAVSGGVDSLYLTHLAHKWCQSSGWDMVALTVDHGLRKESAEEALQVHRWMQEKQVDHRILTWSPPKNLKNIQDQARQARYRLIFEWCELNDIGYLLLGHTLDDQYETCVMRLSHHSGVLGLAGIPVSRKHKNITLVRPLLGVSKKEIIEEMTSGGHNWIEDPSNQREVFTRVRIRKSREFLESQGISREEILRLQRKMGLLRQSWEEESLAWLAENAEFYPEGYIKVCLLSFLELPREKRELIFSSLVKYVSGNKHGPGFNTLDRSLGQLSVARFKPFTCHGCLVEQKEQRLFIYREENQVSDINIEDNMVVWDNRVQIEIQETKSNLTYTIKPLGGHWVHLKGKTSITELPLPVRRTIPGIWQKEKLILVPHLDYDVSHDSRLVYKIKNLSFLDLNCARFIID